MQRLPLTDSITNNFVLKRFKRFVLLSDAKRWHVWPMKGNDETR